MKKKRKTAVQKFMAENARKGHKTTLERHGKEFYSYIAHKRWDKPTEEKTS